MQEAADGGLLGLPGQEALGEGGVERLLHAVEAGFWGKGGGRRREAMVKFGKEKTKQQTAGDSSGSSLSPNS